MRIVHLGRRLSLISATTALATVIATFNSPSAAQAANVYYPSGCHKTANDNYWQTNCWNGYNYVRQSVMTLGAQEVLYALRVSNHPESNPGTPDCYFGPKTDKATIYFQKSWALEQDGIIGRDTWTVLAEMLNYSGLDDDYGGWYNVSNRSGLVFYWQNYLTNTWFVADRWFGNKRVAMRADLMSGFCG